MVVFRVTSFMDGPLGRKFKNLIYLKNAKVWKILNLIKGRP